MRYVIAAFLLMACAGCTLEEHDISDRRDARPFVGARYRTVDYTNAYGVRMEYGDGDPDVVVLTAPPGFDGPEVAFSERVEPGAEFTVLKVLKTNRLLDNPYTLMVRMHGMPWDTGLPVRIDLYGNNDGDRRLSLNPSVYRRIAPPKEAGP